MKLSSLFLTLLALTTTSCQYNYHAGTNITDEQISSISNRVVTKEEIEEKFGSPNLTPDYSPSRWYYVYRSMAKRAFFTPTIKEQRVVVVEFAGDQLASIELQDNKHNAGVQVISEYIRTQGSQKNPIQEYIGNIGRFHKHNNVKSRR